jgi:hypothetical protein
VTTRYRVLQGRRPNPVASPSTGVSSRPSAGVSFPTVSTVIAKDNFAAAEDGPLSGRRPQVGPRWQVSGQAPPAITSGAVASTSTGYAGLLLPARATVMSCVVTWHGKPGAQMTMIMSADPTIRIANAVHFNFGPAGYNLTLRRDNGAFTPFMSGTWTTPMTDGRRFTLRLAVKGDRVWVRGPNGETATDSSSVVRAVAGAEVIWEPNTTAAGGARLVSVSASR